MGPDPVVGARMPGEPSGRAGSWMLTLGLRILRDAQVPLSWFHSPSDWEKTGPVGRDTTGPIIDTGDGGIGEQWICHDGAWLLHVYH